MNLKPYILFLFTLMFGSVAFLNCEPTYIKVNYINNPSPGAIFVGDGNLENGIFNNYSRLIDSAKLSKVPPGLDFHIQANGAMTYYDINTGKFYQLNSQYKVVDSFQVVSSYETDFHELLINTDGSYFMIASRNIVADLSEIVVGGDKEAIVSDQIIQKYNNKKQLVWSYSLYDNLPITDAIDKIDLKSKSVDPYHVNSIDQDPYGNIYVSVRNFNQILKINMSTNAIVWRLGGSLSKNNQFTFTNDEIEGFTGISHTHDVRYLSNGNLLLFDNGNSRTTPFSRAVEYAIDEVQLTATKVWEFIPQPKIYTSQMGSVQRLPNGNTFMLFGTELIEANKFSELVFSATKTTGNFAYRAYKHPYKIFTVQKSIKNTGSYDFTATGNLTYVKMNLQFYDKEGYINITRHDYKPQRYTFNELEPSRIINQRWVVESDINFTSKVTIDLNNFSDYVKGDSIVAYARDNEDRSSFKRLTTSFNKTTRVITIDLSADCEFILTSNEQIINSKPDLLLPRKSDITTKDVNFKWYPIQYAEKYEFQLSDQSNFGNLIATSSELTSTTFTVPNLINGRSYVWRVRALSGLSTSQWSEEWNFKVIMGTPTLLYPVNNTKSVQLNASLGWKHILQSSYYDIQVAKDTSFAEIVIDAKGKLDSSLSLNNLNYRTSYYWRVRAGNLESVTPWSQYYTFRTELKVPNIIYPTQYSNAIPTQLDINFERSEEADYYQLVLDDNNFSGNTINLIVNNKQPEVKVSLEDYKNYVLKIRSISYQDTSRWSDIINFKTIIQKPVLKYPPRFMLLVPVPTLFIIEDVKDASGYELNIVSSPSDANQGNKILLDTMFVSNSSNFNVTFLDKKTTNKWRARTVYLYGKSEWSNFSEFSIGASGIINPPSLTAPANNTTLVPVNGILTWENTSGDIKSYRLLFAEDENFNNIIYNEIVNATSFYYSNLSYNKQYYWKVTSAKDGEFSDWTDTWNFTTKNIKQVTAPNLIYPANGDTVNSNKVEFVWEKLAFASSYHLQIAKDKDFNLLVKEDNSLPGYNYTFEGLESSTEYFWRVRAFNKDENTNGNWSDIHNFKTTSILSILVNEDESESIKEFTLGTDYNLRDINSKLILLEQTQYQCIEDLKEKLAVGVYFLLSLDKNKKSIKFIVK